MDTLAPHHVVMHWPTDADEAVSFLRRNLAPDVIARIRDLPEAELPVLYAELGAYVRSDAGCLTREVAEDLDLHLSEQGLVAGSEFLLYLLWQQLRSRS